MYKRGFWSIFSSAMKFLRKTYSFQEFLFESDMVNQINPHDWQKAHFNKKDVDHEQTNKQKAEKAALPLFTATASSSAVEHAFSTRFTTIFVTKINQEMINLPSLFFCFNCLTKMMHNFIKSYLFIFLHVSKFNFT